jgi:Arc/MetJ-type ribon-helix-helix transcriptional regulator
MSVLSIHISADLEKDIERLIKAGHGANGVEVAIKAIKKLDEDRAVEAVLQAEKEPSLKGDIRDLMKEFADK